MEEGNWVTGRRKAGLVGRAEGTRSSETQNQKKKKKKKKNPRYTEGKTGKNLRRADVEVKGWVSRSFRQGLAGAGGRHKNRGP